MHSSKMKYWLLRSVNTCKNNAFIKALKLTTKLRYGMYDNIDNGKEESQVRHHKKDVLKCSHFQNCLFV